MKLHKTAIGFYLVISVMLLLLSFAGTAAVADDKTSDSEKLDKLFEIMKSFDERLKKLEGKPQSAAANPGKPKSNSKTKATASSTSNNAYAPGWIVKVYKNDIKRNTSKLGNRVGAFIATSLPITAKDHEATSKVSGNTGYKISGYLKISHSAPTTIGMRLFSKKGIYGRHSAVCYRASLSLEGKKIIDAENVRAGTEDAPNIQTGVVNLQPGNYKVDMEYTCIPGSSKSPNYFDITYLTDDMLNAKVVSSDMMLRKAAK